MPDRDPQCDRARPRNPQSRLRRGSGRLWKEHADYFRPKERIDQVLLDNLTQSHKLLCKSLSSDAAQALLIQTIFIAYLEDRKIITPDYVMAATNKAADSFSALLAKHDFGS